MEEKKYSNKDYYFGELKKRHKYGIGVFIRPKILIYIGEWQKSEPGDLGVLITKNSTIFSSKKDNIFYEKNNKNKYDYSLYKKKKKGIIYGLFKKGKNIYRGFLHVKNRNIKNLLIEGRYELENEIGIIKGDFNKKGLLEGIGDLKTNEEFYIGEFSKNLKNGVGFLEIFSRKTIILGYFKNGIPLDFQMILKKDKLISRTVKDDILISFIYYLNGDIYIGGIIEDVNTDFSYKRNGFGCFFSKNYYYIGLWINDQKEGVGIEIKFDINNNDNETLKKSKVRGFGIKEDVFNYLKSLSQSFSENFLNIKNSKSENKNFINFFDSKIDFEKKSDFYGFWKNNNKNGGGILNLEGKEYKGYWLNNQFLGNKINLTDENNQKLFDRKNYEDYAYNKLEEIEKIIREKKKNFLDSFKKVMKKHKEKNIFFEKIYNNINNLILKKRKIKDDCDYLRFEIYSQSNNENTKKILINPFEYLKIKGFKNKNKKLFDRLLESYIHQKIGKNSARSFVLNFKNKVQKKEIINSGFDKEKKEFYEMFKKFETLTDYSNHKLKNKKLKPILERKKKKVKKQKKKSIKIKKKNDNDKKNNEKEKNFEVNDKKEKKKIKKSKSNQFLSDENKKNNEKDSHQKIFAKGEENNNNNLEKIKPDEKINKNNEILEKQTEMDPDKFFKKNSKNSNFSTEKNKNLISNNYQKETENRPENNMILSLESEPEIINILKGENNDIMISKQSLPELSEKKNKKNNKLILSVESENEKNKNNTNILSLDSEPVLADDKYGNNILSVISEPGIIDEKYGNNILSVVSEPAHTDKKADNKILSVDSEPALNDEKYGNNILSVESENLKVENQNIQNNNILSEESKTGIEDKNNYQNNNILSVESEEIREVPKNKNFILSLESEPKVSILDSKNNMLSNSEINGDIKKSPNNLNSENNNKFLLSLVSNSIIKVDNKEEVKIYIKEIEEKNRGSGEIVFKRVETISNFEENNILSEDENLKKESLLKVKGVEEGESKSFDKDYFVKLTAEEKMELKYFLPDKQSQQFNISKNKDIYISQDILLKKKEENYFDQESQKVIKNIEKRNTEIIKNYEPDFSSEEKKNKDLEKRKDSKRITKKNQNFLKNVDNILELN